MQASIVILDLFAAVILFTVSTSFVLVPAIRWSAVWRGRCSAERLETIVATHTLVSDTKKPFACRTLAIPCASFPFIFNAWLVRCTRNTSCFIFQCETMPERSAKRCSIHSNNDHEHFTLLIQRGKVSWVCLQSLRVLLQARAGAPDDHECCVRCWCCARKITHEF